MFKRRVFWSCLIVVAGALVIHDRTLADSQANHLIVVNEVFSNADGTLQFVELQARAGFQTFLSVTRVDALNVDGTVVTLLHDFTADMPQLDNTETILLATQGVQDALGFTADFTIPNGSISFPAGRVRFRNDAGTIIDAVAYGAYTGSNTSYGTPAAALPTNGTTALQRVVYTFPPTVRNNSTDWSTATNSPRNNAGDAGSLQATPKPPVLTPIGSKSTNEGQLLTFNISANDPNGTTPALQAQNLPTGASFNDNHNGNGTFIWTPGFLQSVGSPFDVLFIASDADSADSEVVPITVNEITNPPDARDTTVNVTEDITLPAQLQASDPDGNPLTYTILSGPFNGAAVNLSASNGSFDYDPSNNFNGTDSLKFKVNDGFTNSDTGRVLFNVAAVNDPPVAQDVAVNTIVNTPVHVNAMPVTDVDNASWTISHVDGPFRGSIANFSSAGGSFDYTPDQDSIGLDSIRYVADDGQPGASGGSSPSGVRVIRINVLAACDCSCHADPVCDGVPDVLDVVGAVAVAFRGGVDTVDPACTHVGRTDFNCDCVQDVLDVVEVVARAFRGNTDPFCNACVQTCP